jgi:hypothetical protein
MTQNVCATTALESHNDQPGAAIVCTFSALSHAAYTALNALPDPRNHCAGAGGSHASSTHLCILIAAHTPQLKFEPPRQRRRMKVTFRRAGA